MRYQRKPAEVEVRDYTDADPPYFCVRDRDGHERHVTPEEFERDYEPIREGEPELRNVLGFGIGPESEGLAAGQIRPAVHEGPGPDCFSSTPTNMCQGCRRALGYEG